MVQQNGGVFKGKTMKESTSVVVSNIAFYLFLGLTAYFITPWILLLLILIQGFKSSETKDG